MYLETANLQSCAEAKNIFLWLIIAVNELETEGRHAIESPTTPITVAPDTFDLG